jgi:hypothetical protein
MSLARPLLAIGLLLLLSQCGKTQNTDRSAARAAAKDSIAKANRKAALREAFTLTLDQVQRSVSQSKDMADADRLIHAEYGTFKTLATLVRILDSSAIIRREVSDEEHRLLREDSSSTGQAARIVSGMRGIYSLYGLIYQMRFGLDTQRMAFYTGIHDTVMKKLRREVLAIEAVAAMATGVYEMSKAIVRDIDREQRFDDHFALIEQQFAEGAKSAETDEDRVLNGVYRTYEVAQLWALYLDPAKKEEISVLFRDLLSATKKAQGVGAQLAVGMEHLYKIHDMIARRSIRLTF